MVKREATTRKEIIWVSKSIAGSVRLIGLLAVCMAPEVGALLINFDWAPNSDRRAEAGFEAAGREWSRVLADPITITIATSFRDLNDVCFRCGIVGITQPNWSEDISYPDFRNALITDRQSSDDSIAVGTLRASQSFGLLMNRTMQNPNGPYSAIPYVDDDGSYNNRYMYMTQANMRAIGLYAPAGGSIDASIAFNSLTRWDFDRSDGIDPLAIDFVGTAMHEIGHALGFISDALYANDCCARRFAGWNDVAIANPLDFFRCSSRSTIEGILDWTTDSRSKYLSVDACATQIAEMSTGEINGDGYSDSHWKYDRQYNPATGQFEGPVLGLMDPVVLPGQRLDFSDADLRAFDIIGYDRRAIGEPGTLALLAAGLVGLGVRNRRATKRRAITIR